jgi:hypothetical protein
MWNSRNIFWVFVWWTFPFCAHLRKRIFDRFRLFFLRSFLCRRVQISHSYTTRFFSSIGKMLRRGGRSKLVGVQQQQHQRQLLKTSAKRKMKGNEGGREKWWWRCGLAVGRIIGLPRTTPWGLSRRATTTPGVCTRIFSTFVVTYQTLLFSFRRFNSNGGQSMTGGIFLKEFRSD